MKHHCPTDCGRRGGGRTLSWSRPERPGTDNDNYQRTTMKPTTVGWNAIADEDARGGTKGRRRGDGETVVGSSWHLGFYRVGSMALPGLDGMYFRNVKGNTKMKGMEVWSRSTRRWGCGLYMVFTWCKDHVKTNVKTMPLTKDSLINQRNGM